MSTTTRISNSGETSETKRVGRGITVETRFDSKGQRHQTIVRHCGQMIYKKYHGDSEWNPRDTYSRTFGKYGSHSW